MKIIQTFLNSKLNLFEGIELVMHVICAASVSMSVESVVESVVSMYENRQSKFRHLSDDRANNEMMIAVNGPYIAHSDAILEKSLNTSDIATMGNGILPWIKVKCNIPFPNSLTLISLNQANSHSWMSKFQLFSNGLWYSVFFLSKRSIVVISDLFKY